MEPTEKNSPLGVLDRASLAHLLEGSPPLVEGMPSPDDQLQPNGIDLTLRSAAWLATIGQVGVSQTERVLSSAVDQEFDADGWVHLAAGPYLVTFNEVVHLPNTLTALAWPRSSLLRCGVAIHNAVWDAGYHGRSQCLMSVLNPHGFRVSRDARILQLVFFTLASGVARGYEGIYQGENL
ncbi:MAG: deoxyuridine 5'-triphosphate nucleotidohydrolase [Dehalococcoidia bacterium]|nr:deoxyuridine 5'-triphosphate nucleotidohydrolase [Dehalococcoidia bacterium]